jgi:hypothetical protein
LALQRLEDRVGKDASRIWDEVFAPVKVMTEDLKLAKVRESKQKTASEKPKRVKLTPSQAVLKRAAKRGGK